MGSILRYGSPDLSASHTVSDSTVSGLPGSLRFSGLALAITTNGCNSTVPRPERLVARMRLASSAASRPSAISAASTSPSSRRPWRPRTVVELGIAAIAIPAVKNRLQSAWTIWDLGLAAILTRFVCYAGDAVGRTDFPGRHPDAEPLLGGSGLRAAAAAGSGSRRGHVSSRDVPARARSRSLDRSLRATVPTPDRWPLWRKPQSPAAVLPVPGGVEAESRRCGGALFRFAARARHRSPGARFAPGRGQLGIADAGCVGARLGSVVERDGSHPVHLFPAGRWPRMQARHG